MEVLTLSFFYLSEMIISTCIKLTVSVRFRSQNVACNLYRTNMTILNPYLTFLLQLFVIILKKINEEEEIKKRIV